MALSSPRYRLRGHGGELLPERPYCLRCSALISAWAAPGDRFCIVCAPLVADEPPFDPALYCPQGHLRAEFEVTRTDRSRPSGVKTECRACKAIANKNRDRSVGAIEARLLERREAA